MTAVAETRPAALAGRTELGRITVADSVVTKIAAQPRPKTPTPGALTSEVSAYHGVDSAKGRIIGDGRDPEVAS